MSRSYGRTKALLFGDENHARHFINFFKSKKKKVKVRPGAIDPQEVKKIIEKIGKNKKVNIRRVEFDGTPENEPILVRLADVREDFFTGEIINVERSIKQEMNDKLVYIKGGGGTIDFYYDEGDIMSVEEDTDEQIFEQRNTEELLEILDALDLKESILISYYDQHKSGVMNGVGTLLEKDIPLKTFKVELKQINEIELDEPKTVSLDMNSDTVLDLEVVL